MAVCISSNYIGYYIECIQLQFDGKYKWFSRRWQCGIQWVWRSIWWIKGCVIWVGVINGLQNRLMIVLLHIHGFLTVLRESFLDSLHHSIVIMFRELSVLNKFASANEGRNCLLYGWISWTVIVIVRLSASIVIVKYTLGVVVGNLFFRETNHGLEGTSLVNACPEICTWVNTWVHTQCKCISSRQTSRTKLLLWGSRS